MRSTLASAALANSLASSCERTRRSWRYWRLELMMESGFPSSWAMMAPSWPRVACFFGSLPARAPSSSPGSRPWAWRNQRGQSGTSIRALATVPQLSSSALREAASRSPSSQAIRTGWGAGADSTARASARSGDPSPPSGTGASTQTTVWFGSPSAGRIPASTSSMACRQSGSGTGPEALCRGRKQRSWSPCGS